MSSLPKKIVVDTSFLISLVNSKDEFHKNAKDYFEKSLGDKSVLQISPIVWSEFLIRQKETDLPIMENFQYLTFTIKDAKLAGEITNLDNMKRGDRTSIKDDYKILAQALGHSDAIITGDNQLINLATQLKRERNSLKTIDMKESVNKFLGRFEF
jgi:predicted nucleic acid-binding protein